MPKESAAAVAEMPDGRDSLTAESGRRWFTRLRRRGSSATHVPDQADLQANPLLAFGPERGAAPAAVASDRVPARPRRTPLVGRLLAIGAIACASVLAAGVGVSLLRGAGSQRLSAPASGRLTLATQPVGAPVTIDGVARGSTPLTVTLSPGPHHVTLGNGADQRDLPVNLSAGADVTQYFELATPKPAVTQGGKIAVVTDPSGARVFIDGRASGTSPVTAVDQSAGDHKVAVSTRSGSAERTVAVANGATTSVVFSLGRAAPPAAGWVAFTAPFDVQIRDGDVVVSTGRAARIMLPAGSHGISLANSDLQFEETRQIEVTAGQTTTLKVDPPKATLSANARPWADVIVDGRAVGQTPIANLSIAIGPHDVIFRHPQLGEQRRAIVVTVRGANRVAVDLTKP
jgi:hypothetical protein